MQLPQVVRRITRPLVGRVPITIAGGPNRGMKWSLASAGNGFRRGVREPERMVHLSALIHPGDVVWDVGAHYGYVALLAARLAGPSGRLFAFEPGRRSRWYLSRHVAWNRLTQVTVHPYALADFDGEARFGGSDSTQLFALGGGEELVPVRSGASLVRANVCPPPNFMKVDTEGAELLVLRGVLGVLPRDARLFVAMHSLDAYRACRELMEGGGFRTVAARELERAAAPRWPGDPDAFFIGPEYRDGDADVQRLRESGF
jgi:FkbM family methyltransferase